MKTICCYVSLILVFLTSGICAAEVPNLLGNWTGSWKAYDLENGYLESTENGSINIALVEQNDRIFAGNLVFKMKNGSYSKESFVGAIGLDNKTLNMAEVEEGYVQATLISNDEIDVIYLLDGKEASVIIDRVHRIKA
ncbi:Uncharacterised protein [uncultured archaeon]|nr:Uncharacterised protein [uncultured archaeon]